MKFNKLLIAILGLGVSLSSCNLDNDDEDNYVTSNFTCCNLVVSSEGEAFATTAGYSLTFYYLSDVMTLGTNTLNLGNNNNLSFVSPQLTMSTKYYPFNGMQADVTSFSSTGFTQGNVSIRNLKGCTSMMTNLVGTNDPFSPIYKFNAYTPLILSYNVNDSYTVKTFMKDAVYTGTTNIRTVGDGNVYTNDGVRYRVVFSDDLKKADIIFYNAKFDERMPVTVNFVLQNLDVTYNRSGYVISNPEGQNLIPYTYENGLVENKNYQFTSFQFINASDNLTVGQAIYTVQIGPSTYRGDFTGYYALTSVE